MAREALTERSPARPEGVSVEEGGWREARGRLSWLETHRGWTAVSPTLGQRGMGLGEDGKGAGRGSGGAFSSNLSSPSAQAPAGRLCSLHFCCHWEKNQPRSTEPSTSGETSVEDKSLNKYIPIQET